MALDPKTIELMKEALRGVVCDQCSQPAVRRLYQLWFCSDCWQERENKLRGGGVGVIITPDPRPLHARPRRNCV